MNIINEISHDYDYVFIDCPPSLGLPTLNALCAAKAISTFANRILCLEGLTQLMKTLILKKNFNSDIKLYDSTMYDRNKICEMVSNDVKNHFNDKVLKHYPKKCKNIWLYYGQPVLMYDISCSGAQAYASLAGEIINQEKDVK